MTYRDLIEHALIILRAALAVGGVEGFDIDQPVPDTDTRSTDIYVCSPCDDWGYDFGISQTVSETGERIETELSLTREDY